MRTKYLMFTSSVALGLVVLAGLFMSPQMACATPPNGVDHLRGRWDGVFTGLFDENVSFRLLLDESKQDPIDPQAALYNGSIMLLEPNGKYAPASVRVVDLGGQRYSVTIYGTVAGSVIKLTGVMRTNRAKVTDDTVCGEWQTQDNTAQWSAVHHDRRKPDCPPVVIDDDLYFDAGVNAVVTINADESRSEGALLDGSGNIVASGMRAVLPDGNVVVVPFYSDLFSPTVDFVSNFRFLDGLEGLPVVGGTYTFSLLDVLGKQIPGTTVTDVWYACTMDAPRNVSAVMESGGLHVTWDAVAPGLGFDPVNAVGFYQIELSADGGGFSYGANIIHSTSHTIPWDSFGAEAPGSPDGYDYGASLSELPDGSYHFDVIAFSEGFGAGASGLESQIRASAEQVRFEKAGGVITILP